MRTPLSFTAIFGLCTLALVGCSPDPAQQARIQELQTNPEISLIGEFDGCTVKYVNRYYQEKSFYLARCATTTTSTSNYTVPSGKVRLARSNTVITQEIAQLQAESASAAAREKALEKLTPAERKALGISAN